METSPDSRLVEFISYKWISSYKKSSFIDILHFLPEALIIVAGLQRHFFVILYISISIASLVWFMESQNLFFTSSHT